jgi:hypothetical protein
MSVAPFTRGYLIDLSNRERFEFDFNPDNIVDSQESDISVTKIPGASHPRVAWDGGGLRTISFDLHLVRLSESQPKNYVKLQTAWIQSLITPSDGSDFEGARAPYVQFVLGDLYDLPVLVRKVSKKWGVLDSVTLLPETADLSITMEEVAPENVTLTSVRTGGSGFVRYLPGAR